MHNLEFHCEECEAPIHFSLLGGIKEIVACSVCEKNYLFDAHLLNLLKKFEALCRQIHDSAEILGTSSIAVDVGHHHVKLPFNLLLTRLSSVIELNINGKIKTISFKVEPLHDLNETSV